MSLYFVQKEGVYARGVFWIGTDPEVGKRAADRAASEDRDDYHDWVLYEFSEKPVDAAKLATVNWASVGPYDLENPHRKLHVGVRTECAS